MFLFMIKVLFLRQIMIFLVDRFVGMLLRIDQIIQSKNLSILSGFNSDRVIVYVDLMLVGYSGRGDSLVEVSIFFM